MTPRLITRRVGWTSLCAWACVGLALEAAHGLKLSSYLDDAMVRELCTLAHAHGVGLSIVLIIIGELGVPLVREERRPAVVRAATFATITIPLAFLLATLGHSEGDPGLAIWLVPITAVSLIAALATIAHAAWEARDAS
jgi:hypothetical protein